MRRYPLFCSSSCKINIPWAKCGRIESATKCEPPKATSVDIKALLRVVLMSYVFAKITFGNALEFVLFCLVCLSEVSLRGVSIHHAVGIRFGNKLMVVNLVRI